MKKSLFTRRDLDNNSSSMSNRRNYGSNSGGGHSRFMTQGGGGGGGSNMSPWQSGSSPGRSAQAGGGIPSLFNQIGLGQLSSPDAQLALATKLLSSILPSAGGQPPSLMGGGGGFSGPVGRFGGGGQNYGPQSRFQQRDDRRNNQQYQNKNRRQQNDRGNRRNRNDKAKPKDNAGSASGNKSSQGKKQAPAVKDGDVKKEPEESPVKMEADAENENEKDKEKKEPEGPLPEYEGIPHKLLHCHVCGKSMWNDVSFDTHIKGRNHQQKMRELEESYQMQTDLMRESAAISLKLEEVRRGKRRPYPDQYCKMCDLHFNGMTMFSHRSTDEHQSLKRFIHPTCSLCVADFKSRLEYDEHILTPQHLIKEGKQQERKEMYEKDPKYIALRQEESKFRFMMEELTALNAGPAMKISEDDAKLVTELGLPAYDPEAETPLGADQIVPVEGFLCKVCKAFLLSKETADLHAKTQKHHEVFIGRALDRANKNKNRKDKEGEDKRKNSTNEDGGAKRVKIDADDDGAGEPEADDSEVNGGAEAEGEPEAEGGEEANASVTSEGTPKDEAKDTSMASESESSATTPATPKRATARRGRGRGRK